MENLERIIKLNYSQYSILQAGGTIVAPSGQTYTGINPSYVYLILPEIVDIIDSATINVTKTTNGDAVSISIDLKDGYGDSKNPYGSKTKHHALLAPENIDGNPNFRAIVRSDLPDGISTDDALDILRGE